MIAYLAVVSKPLVVVSGLGTEIYLGMAVVF